MGAIYKITNPSGKMYVGQTHKTVYQRMIQHKSIRGNMKAKSAITASIRKYGFEAHIIEVIEDNIPDELLNEREIYWIAEFKTYSLEYPKQGLNLTKGGDNRMPWKHDKKRVAKAKERKGPNAPSWGKKVKEEVKRQIAKSVSKYNRENGVKPSVECHKKAKEAQYVPVVVYDRNGDFVGEYSYIKAAADALGLTRKCANDVVLGKQNHAEGYILRKKTEGYPMKIDTSGIKLWSRKRPVVCYVGEDVMEFETCAKAAKALGLYHQTVKDAANQNRPMRNGYRFVYKDSLTQNRPRIAGRAA